MFAPGIPRLNYFTGCIGRIGRALIRGLVSFFNGPEAEGRRIRGGRAVDPQGVGYGTVDNSDGAFDPEGEELVVEWFGEVPYSTGDVCGVETGWLVYIDPTNIGVAFFSSTVPTQKTTAHGASPGDWIRVRLTRAAGATTMSVSVDNVAKTAMTGLPAYIDPGAGDLAVFDEYPGATADVYPSLFAELKISVNEAVVGWWATGCEESGTYCPSLIAGSPGINWVSQPADFFVESNEVAFNPCDEWGYAEVAEDKEMTWIGGEPMTWIGGEPIEWL